MGEPRRSLPENLSAPARRALEQAGYTDLEQLSNASDSELLDLHGFGPEGLLAVQEALAQAGLRTSANPQGAPSAPTSREAKTGETDEAPANRGAARGNERRREP